MKLHVLMRTTKSLFRFLHKILRPEKHSDKNLLLDNTGETINQVSAAALLCSVLFFPKTASHCSGIC